MTVFAIMKLRMKKTQWNFSGILIDCVPGQGSGVWDFNLSNAICCSWQENGSRRSMLHIPWRELTLKTLKALVLQEELESVQKRAARFVTGNYNYETGSMTGILGQLKWESLKNRRKDNRLILLYKGLKGKASVSTDDLIPKTRRCRNQHSMAFQTPIANTDVYKGSFFPQTIRDWNALPDSLIWSAEDAEDCVAKFTSLVRARD